MPPRLWRGKSPKGPGLRHELVEIFQSERVVTQRKKQEAS